MVSHQVVSLKDPMSGQRMQVRCGGGSSPSRAPRRIRAWRVRAAVDQSLVGLAYSPRAPDSLGGGSGMVGRADDGHAPLYPSLSAAAARALL